MHVSSHANLIATIHFFKNPENHQLYNHVSLMIGLMESTETVCTTTLKKDHLGLKQVVLHIMSFRSLARILDDLLKHMP